MRVKGYYYKDKDQAFLVSESDFKAIQKAIMHGLPVDTHGHTLYPIFTDPSEEEIRAKKTKTVAWLIRDGQSPTARWYWQIKEHRKADTGCKTLGGGLCGFKMIRYAQWDDESKKWELLPMLNHADSEQEKVLGAN